jgi:hypothetical protein
VNGSVVEIVKRDFAAGPIHEQLLRGTVFLAPDQVLLLLPALVVVAEATVGIAIRMGGSVLFPEQLQGGVFVLLQPVPHLAPVR